MAKISTYTAKDAPVAADSTIIVDSVGGASKKILLGKIPLLGNAELIALTTGLLKNTTGTGTLSIAVDGTDYLSPISTTPADHGYSGTAVSWTAGENLVMGNAVYLFNDAGTAKCKKALATAAATMPCIGLATATINSGNSGVILLKGFFRDESWTFTPGGRLWISKDTAGLLTQTQPAVATNLVQDVGIAYSATVIFFDPIRTLIEVA